MLVDMIVNVFTTKLKIGKCRVKKLTIRCTYLDNFSKFEVTYSFTTYNNNKKKSSRTLSSKMCRLINSRMKTVSQQSASCNVDWAGFR